MIQLIFKFSYSSTLPFVISHWRGCFTFIKLQFKDHKKIPLYFSHKQKYISCLSNIWSIGFMGFPWQYNPFMDHSFIMVYLLLEAAVGSMKDLLGWSEGNAPWTLSQHRALVNIQAGSNLRIYLFPPSP